MVSYGGVEGGQLNGKAAHRTQEPQSSHKSSTAAKRRRGWECQGSGMNRSRRGSRWQAARAPGGHVYTYAYFPALSAEKAWKQWHRRGTEHPSAQILVSNTILHYKELGVPGKMADDGAERGDGQEEPGKSHHAKSKQVLKNDMM